MKKNNLLAAYLFITGIAVLPAHSQNNAMLLHTYAPAPGQHINIENTGTPQAAQKMTENIGSLVSLGSFGGYVILKFNEACVNHPENPYGIDFTIFGNAFSGSSEPGVVWVMNDSNQNGLPDDTWYEIAGSKHFFSETVRNYEVTYFETATRDVPWKNNQGETGRISANEYNLQEYYPGLEYFPFYPRDSVKFSGTLLKNGFITSEAGEIRLAAPFFGYADSHSRVQDVDLNLPDNPYSHEIEGAGGDPVDISWAVDPSGNYIDLDSIHFVKIVSGSLNVAGWLGEISTDVAWVQDVPPQPHITGKESILVSSQLPSQIVQGDSLQLEAFYFEKGKVIDEQVVFHSYNQDVASVNASGMLMAHALGQTQIQYSARGEKETVSLKVVVPESIRFTTDFSALYPGDTLELSAVVYDNEAEKLNLTPRFSSSDSLTGKIITIEDKPFLVALQPGTFTLTAAVDNFHVEEAVTININAQDYKVNVPLTIKTGSENILPLQWVEVRGGDLNVFVENRQNNYSGLEKITLFHALATGLQKVGVPFKFRDDEAAGGKLYLYMIENDGLFSYGWGGKTNPAGNARAWIARKNGSPYLSDFDNISVADGDTVVLYHVPDILSEWNYTRLLPDRFSAAKGEGVAMVFEQTSCIFQNGDIQEAGFFPVTNALISAGNSWYTNESGKVTVFHEGDFPLVITAGNDAVLITEEVAVSAGFPSYVFRLYPNPVTNSVIISGKFAGSEGSGKLTIKFIGPGGNVVLKKEASSLPVNLDISSFAPGIYQLMVTDGSVVETHKVVKR